MRRYSPKGTSLSYSFGPGPMTPAVKILILTNVAIYLLEFLSDSVVRYFGLSPYRVIEHLSLWQPVTYMFLHGGAWHILWNMLTLWMFGVELERLWGTKFFVKFYLASGLAGAALTLLFSVLPVPFGAALYLSTTIGASGAIIALLLAYGMYFPDRPLYMIPFPFAIAAKYFVMIFIALTFLVSSGQTAWAAHLGGLAGGYVFLKFGRARPLAEVKYRYFKWKMNRLRRKFDIHEGGRAKDWDRKFH